MTITNTFFVPVKTRLVGKLRQQLHAALALLIFLPFIAAAQGSPATVFRFTENKFEWDTPGTSVTLPPVITTSGSEDGVASFSTLSSFANLTPSQQRRQRWTQGVIEIWIRADLATSGQVFSINRTATGALATQVGSSSTNLLSWACFSSRCTNSLKQNLYVPDIFSIYQVGGSGVQSQSAASTRAFNGTASASLSTPPGYTGSYRKLSIAGA